MCVHARVSDCIVVFLLSNFFPLFFRPTIKPPLTRPSPQLTLSPLISPQFLYRNQAMISKGRLITACDGNWFSIQADEIFKSHWIALRSIIDTLINGCVDIYRAWARYVGHLGGPVKLYIFEYNIEVSYQLLSCVNIISALPVTSHGCMSSGHKIHIDFGRGIFVWY